MSIKSKVILLSVKYLPILEWSKSYRLSYLKNDIIAGLTVGLTLIPQALAYGSLAGLKPQYGLFSSFWGPFVYLFLGTSRDLTLGPTAILSLLVAHYSQQSPIKQDPTYAIALALLAGSIQFFLGLFKLGFLANFMSPTVVSSFTSSGAILIAWGQVKTLFGLQNIHSAFFQSIYQIFSNISYANISDTCLGLCCMIILLMFKTLNRVLLRINSAEISQIEKIFNKFFWFITISSNIIVIIFSTIIAYTLHIYEIGDLTLIGSIKQGLPQFQVPRFSISNATKVLVTPAQLFQQIGSGIPVITVIALVEAMAIGKAFARKNGYKIRSSQEFIAIGFSNIIGSFFQAFPITGSFSRTAINSQCSSKSPISGVITGILIVLALQVLTPFFQYIPKTTLAAIIIIAVAFMTDFGFLRRTWKINKYDTFTWVVTFIVALATGVEYGVFTGIAISILPILYEASRPQFTVESSIVKYGGGQLWFPFISKLSALIESSDSGKYLILDLKGVRSIDSAVFNCIAELSEECRDQQKMLIVLSDSSHIRELISYYSNEYNILCFKSTMDAEEYFPNILKEDWYRENISITPITAPIND